MDILCVSTSIAAYPAFPKVFSGAGKKQLRARPTFCLGSESYGDLEVHEPMDNEPLKKHNDIWKLFREAQQNILYLNNQRLLALKELERMKKEKVALHDRIKELEAKQLVSSREETESMTSELLLRIDSMVLTGAIDNREASELRRLVMNSRVSVIDNLFEIIHMNDAELLAELRNHTHKRKKWGFHVIHICTEMAPVTSVGSLASYVTGLSSALQKNGHLIEVILPKYGSLNLDEIQGLQEVKAEFYSFFNGQLHGNRIWTGVIYGIAVTFIQPIYYSSFFSLDRMYGYTNDFERFAYFSRASLDYIVKVGKQPDVLHIHNWETSIVAPLFWEIFVNQGLEGTKILLTCQGFDSQCLEQPEKLALCGLEPSRLHRPDRLQDNKKAHLVNILKGGIVYSNNVIVMSSTQTKAQIIHALDHGLESTFAFHKDKMLLSPHGFDKSIWDPSVDQLLPQNYNAEDTKGKSLCKNSLQKTIGLTEDTNLILVACVCSDFSDFDTENLKALICMASRKGVQLLVMAHTKNSVNNKEFECLQEELQEGNLRFLNKYDEALLHLILAGSDIILCPSFEDPVLQLPLKALKYGTIPVAANFDDNSRFRQEDGEHDFECTKVSKYINNFFAKMSLSQAIDELMNNPYEWKRKMVDAMTKDFSWDSECYDIHVSAYVTVKNL